MTTDLQLLTPAQIEEFGERGFVMLRAAFSPSDAEAAREILWRRLAQNGVRRDDPATWKRLIQLKETFGGGPFARAWTPRLRAAIDDLLGAGRWVQPPQLGWWPVAFPGFDRAPWRAPRTGWHLDGAHFRHRLAAPDQGLLPLFFFSTVNKGEGGTAASIGSHRVAARVLAQSEPHGLSVYELGRRVMQAIPDLRATAHELTGAAGDVALLHPFVLHARSPKIGGEVRFICNPCVTLRAPLQFDPQARPLSPVEAAIHAALHEAA